LWPSYLQLSKDFKVQLANFVRRKTNSILNGSRAVVSMLQGLNKHHLLRRLIKTRTPQRRLMWMIDPNRWNKLPNQNYRVVRLK
jgi:hypothetical protein